MWCGGIILICSHIRKKSVGKQEENLSQIFPIFLHIRHKYTVTLTVFLPFLISPVSPVPVRTKGKKTPTYKEQQKNYIKNVEIKQVINHRRRIVWKKHIYTSIYMWIPTRILIIFNRKYLLLPYTGSCPHVYVLSSESMKYLFQCTFYREARW